MFLLLASDAQACQCAESEIPVCAQYWRSKAVFIATVTEHYNPPPDEHGMPAEGTFVQLSVEKVYRGEVAETVFDVQGQGADCRIVYEKGKRYLLYAYSYEAASSKIATSGCSRSREAVGADEDLAYISNVSETSKSSILGRVLQGKYKPLKGIKVEVEHQGKKYKAVTDSEGRFKIAVPRAGKYIVRAIGVRNSAFLSYRDDGKGYEINGLPIVEFEEEVQQGGCAYLEFDLFIDEDSKDS